MQSHSSHTIGSIEGVNFGVRVRNILAARRKADASVKINEFDPYLVTSGNVGQKGMGLRWVNFFKKDYKRCLGMLSGRTMDFIEALWEYKPVGVGNDEDGAWARSAISYLEGKGAVPPHQVTMRDAFHLHARALYGVPGVIKGEMDAIERGDAYPVGDGTYEIHAQGIGLEGAVDHVAKNWAPLSREQAREAYTDSVYNRANQTGFTSLKGVFRFFERADVMAEFGLKGGYTDDTDEEPDMSGSDWPPIHAYRWASVQPPSKTTQNLMEHMEDEVLGSNRKGFIRDISKAIRIIESLDDGADGPDPDDDEPLFEKTEFVAFLREARDALAHRGKGPNVAHAPKEPAGAKELRKLPHSNKLPPGSGGGAKRGNFDGGGSRHRPFPAYAQPSPAAAGIGAPVGDQDLESVAQRLAALFRLDRSTEGDVFSSALAFTACVIVLCALHISANTEVRRSGHGTSPYGTFIALVGGMFGSTHLLDAGSTAAMYGVSAHSGRFIMMPTTADDELDLSLGQREDGGLLRDEIERNTRAAISKKNIVVGTVLGLAIMGGITLPSAFAGASMLTLATLTYGVTSSSPHPLFMIPAMMAVHSMRRGGDGDIAAHIETLQFAPELGTQLLTSAYQLYDVAHSGFLDESPVLAQTIFGTSIPSGTFKGMTFSELVSSLEGRDTFAEFSAGDNDPDRVARTAARMLFRVGDDADFTASLARYSLQVSKAPGPVVHIEDIMLDFASAAASHPTNKDYSEAHSSLITLSLTSHAMGDTESHWLVEETQRRMAEDSGFYMDTMRNATMRPRVAREGVWLPSVESSSIVWSPIYRNVDHYIAKYGNSLVQSGMDRLAGLEESERSLLRWVGETGTRVLFDVMYGGQTSRVVDAFGIDGYTEKDLIETVRGDKDAVFGSAIGTLVLMGNEFPTFLTGYVGKGATDKGLRYSADAHDKNSENDPARVIAPKLHWTANAAYSVWARLERTGIMDTEASAGEAASVYAAYRFAMEAFVSVVMTAFLARGSYAGIRGDPKRFSRRFIVFLFSVFLHLVNAPLAARYTALLNISTSALDRTLETEGSRRPFTPAERGRLGTGKLRVYAAMEAVADIPTVIGVATLLELPAELATGQVSDLVDQMGVAAGFGAAYLALKAAFPGADSERRAYARFVASLLIPQIPLLLAGDASAADRLVRLVGSVAGLAVTDIVRRVLPGARLRPISDALTVGNVVHIERITASDVDGSLAGSIRDTNVLKLMGDRFVLTDWFTRYQAVFIFDKNKVREGFSTDLKNIDDAKKGSGEVWGLVTERVSGLHPGNPNKLTTIGVVALFEMYLFLEKLNELHEETGNWELRGVSHKTLLAVIGNANGRADVDLATSHIKFDVYITKLRDSTVEEDEKAAIVQNGRVIYEAMLKEVVRQSMSS